MTTLGCVNLASRVLWVLADTSNIIPEGSAWATLYEQNEDTVQYLVPLMPTMGIVIIVIKVLMTASARGRD